MSHIHEALKKAQREKDVHFLYHADLIAMKAEKRRFPGYRVFLGIFLIAFLILLAFLSYSWLDFAPPQIEAKTDQSDQKPITVPQQLSFTLAKESYERARLSHEKGDMEEAKKLYRKALVEDPGFVDALNNLGVIFVREGNYEAAEEALEKGARLKPGHKDLFYNLACLYAIKGEAEKGLISLEKALAMDPSVKKWAQTDRDLENLRTLPEFKRLMERDAPSIP